MKADNKKQPLHADADELRSSFEQLVTPDTLEELKVSYAEEDLLPAAVRFRVEDKRFRLEKDLDTQEWILATDEVEPKLLDHFAEGDDGFEDWLLTAVARHIG
jgi:hypothetical protein